MSQMIDNMQVRLKSSSSGLLTFLLKIVSGGLLGLTFALAGQEVMGYGNLLFLFVIVTITGAFARITKDWTAPGVLLCDLIFVLIALLLRMYIVVAPG